MSAFPLSSRLLLSLVLALCLSRAVGAPASVLLRVPAGKPVPAELAPLLANWRQSGKVAGVLLLTQGRSENPALAAKFAAFAVLEFSSEAACDAWQRDAAPALPAGLVARRADVLAHNEISPRDSAHAVFIVNTYAPTVPAARFAEFVAGYVQPLYEAMLATRRLVRYSAYLERGETGKVDALNVLEYRDADAYTALVAEKTSIRDKVAAAVPTYGQFDKIKDTLRIDGHGTTATYTELPPAAP